MTSSGRQINWAVQPKQTILDHGSQGKYGNRYWAKFSFVLLRKSRFSRCGREKIIGNITQRSTFRCHQIETILSSISRSGCPSNSSLENSFRYCPTPALCSQIQIFQITIINWIQVYCQHIQKIMNGPGTNGICSLMISRMHWRLWVTRPQFHLRLKSFF